MIDSVHTIPLPESIPLMCAGRCMPPWHVRRLRDSQQRGRGRFGGHSVPKLPLHHHWWPYYTNEQCRGWPPPRGGAPLARGRNPASAAEGIIPDMRAWYCIGSIIGDLQSQRAVPGRPPRRAAAGRLAAEAENCEEPWRPLGAPKWNSKPCTAFVTSCTVCIHAPAPKQAIPQNRYSGAAHPDRANVLQ